MYTLLSIIILVFAILQIVLFFKMWRMTNNVKKIAKKLGCYNEPKDEVRKALLMNDKDKAVDILKMAMVQDIIDFADAYTSTEYASLARIYEVYGERFKKLGIDEVPILKCEKVENVRELME